MLGKLTTILITLLMLSGCGYNNFYFNGEDPGDNFTNTVVGYYDYNGVYRAPDTPMQFYFGPFGRNRIKEYRE